MIIIMLGAPNTGKGTVAKVLSAEMNIPQISTGDIFRKQIKEKTELGKLAEKYISQGQLVPDEITINLVKARINEDDTQNGMILDGFPRTVKQAEELEKILQEENKKVDLALNLTTPDEEIVQRGINRRVCPECKAVYNVILHPPKVEGICDKCGHRLEQRKDDNEETIRLRLKTYFSETSPLIKYYENKGVLRTEEVTERLNRFGKDVADDVVKDLLK